MKRQATDAEKISAKHISDKKYLYLIYTNNTTVKYSAHVQEVNCVDCKGGIIVSGSRDRTAKVRAPPYILLFPPVYREWGGRGWIGA